MCVFVVKGNTKSRSEAGSLAASVEVGSWEVDAMVPETPDTLHPELRTSRFRLDEGTEP